MSTKAVFTMKLEPELRDAFMAAAEADHRPASQVVRELMRSYVERQQSEEFLQAKVDAARNSAKLGLGRANDEVEADFAARRGTASA